MTNPLTAESGSLKMPPIFQPTTYRQMRDDGTIPRNVGFDRNAIRYVSHRGRRYYIDLSSGAFDEYFAKFAAKTRNTLKRKLRHFAERSGGTVDFRVYSSPDEIIEFRRQALTVSLVSYQRKIGFGLPETEDFLTSLVEQATNRKVYGFLLMANEKAVAYVYCPIDQDILVYSYCGYDPEFAQSSPGTALLFLIIRWSFQQKKFRMFDLGNDSWDYKAMFATGAVKYLKVMWFPKRLSYFVIIILHMLVLRAWSGAASLKETSTSWAQRLRSEGMRFTSSHRTDPKADGADTLRRPRKRE